MSAKPKIEDKDVSPQMTMEEMKNEMKAYQLKLNRNIVELAGSIAEKSQTTPKPIMRDGQEVINEETGEIRFYPVNYSIKISFDGGLKEIPVSEDWFNSLKMDGTRYMFTGRLALVKVYGKESVDVKFSNYSEI